MQLIKPVGNGIIQANQFDGQIDGRLALARQNPRRVADCVRAITAMATGSVSVAEQCYYAKPRFVKGKREFDVGPNVKLADIVVACWGNLRVEAEILAIAQEYVAGQATCWDLQANTSVTVQNIQSIIGAGGRRYPDDAVANNALGAMSRARRNAIFAVAPCVLYEHVWRACMSKVTDDSAKQLDTASQNALDWLAGQGVTEEVVLSFLGLKTPAEITPSHVARLRGVTQSFKTGEITDLIAAFGGPATPNGTWRKGRGKASAQHADNANSIPPLLALEAAVPGAGGT